MTPDQSLLPRANSPAPDRIDRLIPIAVNLLGLVAVALLALYLGGALATGVTTRAVAFIGLAGVLALIAIAPHASLIFWVTFSPFGRLLNLTLGRGLPDLSFERVMAMGLIAALSAQAVAGRRRLARLTAVEGWGALFALGMALSVGASRLGVNAGLQSVFDTIVVPLLYFYFARNLLSERGRLRWLAVAAAILGATLGIIAAREQLTGQTVFSPIPYRWAYGESIVKVTSFFGAPAVMAMTLAVPLPFVLVGALRSRGLVPRLLWTGALLAMAAGLLFTYVRAGWLGAICGVVAVVALTRRFRAFALALLLILLLIVFGSGRGLLDTSIVQDRIESQEPITYRIQAIRIGLDLAATSPLVGLGLDNYSEAAAAAGWQPRSGNAALAISAHNMFIYVLTSGGLLALAPLLALLATLVWRALRITASGAENRDWGAAALGMVIAYLIVANTIDALTAQLAHNLFYLCLGAIFGFAETQRARQAAQAALSTSQGGTL